MRVQAAPPPASAVPGAATLLLAGLVLSAATGPARADAPPPLMPTRDVSVVYSVQPDGAPQPQDVHVFFGGSGNFMRVDGPPGPDGGASGDMIMDRNGRTMTVVLNQPRVFMQLPERDEVRFPFLLDPTMQFRRSGTSQVANLPCTTYDITTGKGTATACVTADGVVLSEQGVDSEGAKGHLVARTVSYGPVPPTTFQPPPGFQRVAHPEGPPTGGGGPMSSPNAPMPELPPGAAGR
ncbi:MAG: hypothetical protein INR65_10255 [Gluconacetobacter diazotrophicus]|nr:hypothetical protein [Gluconacetobacter diazotrophicus]